MKSSVPGPAYTGACGGTRTEFVHYACPSGAMLAVEAYQAINASTDPDLARRLLSDDPSEQLNTVQCPSSKEPTPLPISVIYHDPGNQLFVLVLPAILRHRELEERIAVLQSLADDPAPVPPYAVNFELVYGAAGLKELLQKRAETELAASRNAQLKQELDLRAAEIGQREEQVNALRTELDRVAAELDRTSNELQQSRRELEDRAAALDRRSAELERLSADVDRRGADLRAAKTPAPALAEPDSESSPTEPIARPVPRIKPAVVEKRAKLPTPRRRSKRDSEEDTPLPAPVPHEAIKTHPFELIPGGSPPDEEVLEVEPEELDAGEVVVADQMVNEDASRLRRTVTEDGATRVGGVTDVAIERWIVSGDHNLKLVDETGLVRLAVTAEAPELEVLLDDNIDLKLQLHRMPAYALVTLSIGTPEALHAGTGAAERYTFVFDIGDPLERRVLDSLAREFTFTLELYDSEYLPVRKRTVTANLADNVAMVLSAADHHMSQIPQDERSHARGMVAFDDPSYDRFGWEHPEHKEFRDDKLRNLTSPKRVRRALAIAERFSKPEREEYLVLVRGFPLRLWQQLRSEVIRRGVELGLWPGPRLAQLAVSEGLARSRKELVSKLAQHFSETASAAGLDLDAEAIADNWADLEREAPDGPIQSTQEPVVAGTIPGAKTQGDLERLLARLEDKDLRLDAAVELARRGEERAIGAVFNTLRRMTRGEAVKVLGASVGFGPKAAPHLIDGLRSRKGFLRQGCALALAVLKSEEGVEAICDLLVSEPTEIWRELARAIGEVGPAAVMSLATRLKQQRGEGQDRIAWALAHVAAHGGQRQIQTLAEGRDPVASKVARRGLQLTAEAQSDDDQVRGAAPARDQTVKRAFSRRFFEALNANSSLGHGKGDISGPAMLLDESDLIEAADLDDDLEMLDESDLIPT